MDVFMDISTANPSFITIDDEGIITVSYDAYIKSNIARSEGKWYSEIEVLTGHFNLGVVKESYSTPTGRTGTYVNAVFNYEFPIIFATGSGNVHDGRGTVNGGFLYRNSAVPIGSTIGLLMDMDNKRIRFFVNEVAYPYVDLLHDDPMCMVVNGNSPTSVNRQQVKVNLGSEKFKYVSKELPVETKSFDGSRYVREDLGLPFLEKGDKKYVVKKGLVELRPPVRSVHTLDNMVNVTAEHTNSWRGVFTPYNVLNQYSDHKHDAWIVPENKRTGKLTIDYGRVNPISGVRMTPRYLNSTTAGQGAMATNFDIYGSIDGKAWINIHEVRNSTGWAYNTVRDFMFTETMYYRFLKFDFLSTQASNSLYLSIGNITALVEETALIEFDSNYLEPLTELNMEEMEGIADQITENKVIISKDEFDSRGEKVLSNLKGSRTIKLTGGDKVWEI